MGDCTLIDDEIKQAVKEHNLLQPFREDRLKGASYDISAGDVIIIAYPKEEGGLIHYSLKTQGKITIPPGRTCVIFSLEKVNMPLNMKGRLSLRSHLATQLISFAGGLIDPGYKGFLFLPLANLSDSPITIHYQQPIVTAEFVRLEKPARVAYTIGEEILTIPESRLPPLPIRKVYDPVELSRSIDEIADKVKRYEPEIASTRAIVEFVMLAAIAGALAGIIVAMFREIPKFTDIAAIGGIAILFALLCLFILKAIKRK